MGYEISFKAKIEEVNMYFKLGGCDKALIEVTPEMKGIIEDATGLEWRRGTKLGPCKDVVRDMTHGIFTLLNCYNKRDCKFEIANVIVVFSQIIGAWGHFLRDHCDDDCELAEALSLWVE